MRNSQLPQTRAPFQTLFSRMFGDSLADIYGAEPRAADVAPRTDIRETDDDYELAFELPGVLEADIDVQVHDATLTVTAERKDRRAEQPDSTRWHRVEHRYGKFRRAIALPKGTAVDGIEATYKSGVLYVKVPKAPAAKPAQIAVQSV